MQSWRQAPGYGCRNGSGDGSPTHLNKRRMKKLGIITLLCILATDCEAQIMGGSHWDCSHGTDTVLIAKLLGLKVRHLKDHGVSNFAL